MVQGRRRPARPQRRRGGRVPWLWLLILVAIGVGVVAARTLGRPRGETPRAAEPAFEVVATATPKEVPTARPRGVDVSSRVERTTATPAPATVAPVLVSVRTATATPVPTRAIRSPSAVAERPTATLEATQPAAHSEPTRPATPSSAAGAVELTFDAGADRGYAEDILDVLQEEHVAASFGITGQWARANPDLVRRMAADGHMVFNHTLDHRSFTGLSDSLAGLSASRRRAELDDADAIIAPLIGHSTRPWYRLPYGDDDARVAADVQPAGYTRKVGWTVDSLGWRGSQAPDIVARCLKLAAPGAVYVFHVGRTSQDALALRQIIDGLRERGLDFRRVDGG